MSFHSTYGAFACSGYGGVSDGSEYSGLHHRANPGMFGSADGANARHQHALEAQIEHLKNKLKNIPDSHAREKAHIKVHLGRLMKELHALKSDGDVGALGAFGAAAGRPLRYSRDQAISKFPRFRDEDERLKVAFATNNTKLATKSLARVARLRDHFYKAAALAAQGKAKGQVAGRVYSAIYTGGLTEMLRLTGAGKGAVGKARAKRAEHFLALGDACEAIFRFWKSKFGDGHTSGDKTFHPLDIAKIRSLAVPGKTQSMPPAEGEDVAAEIEEDASPEFQPSAPQRIPGPARRFAPKRAQVSIGEEIESGVPSSDQEFSWAGFGAIALGALGGLIVAPRIGL